jgi:hypothetical protein
MARVQGRNGFGEVHRTARQLLIPSRCHSIPPGTKRCGVSQLSSFLHNRFNAPLHMPGINLLLHVGIDSLGLRTEVIYKAIKG